MSFKFIWQKVRYSYKDHFKKKDGGIKGLVDLTEDKKIFDEISWKKLKKKLNLWSQKFKNKKCNIMPPGK